MKKRYGATEVAIAAFWEAVNHSLIAQEHIKAAKEYYEMAEIERKVGINNAS